MSNSVEESIKVVVRIRPDDESKSCVKVQDNSLAIFRNNNGVQELHNYSFDRIFHANATQEDVFETTLPLIKDGLNGFNVNIFAFGMTGSGKTHTIAGTQLKSTFDEGIIPRTVKHIFSTLREQIESSEKNGSFAMVFISFIELYNNVLYDLLSFDQQSSSILTLHDTHDGVQITGSSTIRTPVSSAEEALELIAKGNKIRATSATNLNERSSRSHTVVSFEIVTQEVTGGGNAPRTPTARDKRTNTHIKTKVGKINLVDLAGSERVKMSGAEGQTLEEAKQINKVSLLKVILK